jgi:hypothetical protein
MGRHITSCFHSRLVVCRKWVTCGTQYSAARPSCQDDPWLGFRNKSEEHIEEESVPKGHKRRQNGLNEFCPGCQGLEAVVRRNKSVREGDRERNKSALRRG